MDHRTRVAIAALATVGLFLCVQVGALALLDQYVAADVEPVDDPSDPGNVAFFFAVILVATAAMLVAIRYDLERLIQGFVVFACGWIAWLVLDVLATSLAGSAIDVGEASPALSWAIFLVPVLVALGLVAALLLYPEWYVIDATGVLLGAGAAGLFGLSFRPHLTIAFLVVLAAYDAISVYGTEHMLTLAEGVSDLNLPIMFVVPTVPGFSLVDDQGPSSLTGDAASAHDGADGRGEVAGQPGDSAAAEAAGTEPTGTDAAGTDAAGTDAATAAPETEEPVETTRRDAIYIGLGDAVMPTILAASAAAFLRDAAPLYDVPLLAVNLPALTAVIGTLAGLVVLLWLVLKGRAHAGLPLLNGGAIGGYLLGALASGLTLAEALGLPL